MPLRVPAAVVILAQVLDLCTTWLILDWGGREGNPASAYLLAAGGFGVLALAKAALCALSVASGVVLVRRGFGHLARPAMCAVGLVYSIVIFSNLHQLATG